MQPNQHRSDYVYYCQGCRRTFPVPINTTGSTPPPLCQFCNKPTVPVRSEYRTPPTHSGKRGPSGQVTFSGQPAKRPTGPQPTTRTHTQKMEALEEGHSITLSKQFRCPITKVLGQGGNGKVFEVEDPFLRRPQALKVLLSQRSAQQQDLQKQRFLREIKITAHLEHPNITPVYEGGCFPDGSPYLVMKEIKGGTLKNLLEPLSNGMRRKSLRELLEIFLKICHAIQFAHSKGIIHRDLKPSNVAVGDFGEVIVMDWGLAKHVKEKDPDTGEVPDVMDIPELEGDISMAGSMIGTPAFMPPEQANGRSDLVGKRSDIYSLGAILYTILTLTPPFQGSAQKAVTKLLMEDPELPRERAPFLEIPKPLEAIAVKCMAKETDQRYPSIKRVVEDLQAYLEDLPVSCYEPTIPEKIQRIARRHSALLLGIFGVVLIIGLSIYLVTAQKIRSQNQKLADERKLRQIEEEKLQKEKKLREAERRRTKAEMERAELEKKRAEQEREKVAEFQKMMAARKPYFLAKDQMMRNMKFRTLKKVVIPKLNQSLEIYPGFLEARLELVKVYSYLRWFDKAMGEAVQFFKYGAGKNESKKFSQLMFRIAFAMQNSASARAKSNTDYAALLEQNRPQGLPSSGWYLFKCMILAHLDAKTALSEIERYMEKPEGQSWEMHNIRAFVLSRLKRYEESLQASSRTIREYPFVPYPYLMKASVLLRLRRYEEAVKAYYAVTRLDATCEIVWLDLGQVMMRQAYKNPQKSEERLAHLLKALRYAQKAMVLEKNYKSHQKKCVRVLNLAYSHLKKQYYPSLKSTFLKSFSFRQMLLQRAVKNKHKELSLEASIWVAEYFRSREPQGRVQAGYLTGARKYLKQYRRTRAFRYDLDRRLIETLLDE